MKKYMIIIGTYFLLTTTCYAQTCPSPDKVLNSITDSPNVDSALKASIPPSNRYDVVKAELSFGQATLDVNEFTGQDGIVCNYSAGKQPVLHTIVKKK